MGGEELAMIMVDGLKVWTKRRPFHLGSCHLTTDEGLEVLHAFAARLDMRREWYQDHIYAPHYDLVPSRRAIALEYGAVYVDAVEQARRRRAKGIGIGLWTYEEWLEAEADVEKRFAARL